MKQQGRRTLKQFLFLNAVIAIDRKFSNRCKQMMAIAVCLVGWHAGKCQGKNPDTDFRYSKDLHNAGSISLVSGSASSSQISSGSFSSGSFSSGPGGVSMAFTSMPDSAKLAFRDTIPARRIDWDYAAKAGHPFPFRSLILPGAMIAYGFTALNVHGLKEWNQTVKEQIWTDDPHHLMHLDNYLLFAPGVSIYALNLAGIHGKHNLKDVTMLYLMTSLIAEGTVFSLKSMTHQLRPDGSNYSSFPSGHTAEAFAGAELMRLEYKDVSPWYGMAGYAMAVGTGMLRMYNNKHWFSDVVTGAGIGIASTRVAWWLYPVMQQAFGKKGTTKSVIMPTYSNGSFGLAYAHTF